MAVNFLGFWTILLPFPLYFLESLVENLPLKHLLCIDLNSRGVLNMIKYKAVSIIWILRKNWNLFLHLSFNILDSSPFQLSYFVSKSLQRQLGAYNEAWCRSSGTAAFRLGEKNVIFYICCCYYDFSVIFWLLPKLKKSHVQASRIFIADKWRLGPPIQTDLFVVVCFTKTSSTQKFFFWAVLFGAKDSHVVSGTQFHLVLNIVFLISTWDFSSTRLSKLKLQIRQ